MIKIHYYNSGSKTVQHDFNMMDFQLPIHNGDLVWVDLYAYSYNELNNIADVFGFHPLSVMTNHFPSRILQLRSMTRCSLPIN